MIGPVILHDDSNDPCTDIL